MDHFNLAGAVGVGTLTATYLYFGGRISIALVILVGYGIYCNETGNCVQEKSVLNPDMKKSCCSDKKTEMCIRDRFFPSFAIRRRTVT